MVSVKKNKMPQKGKNIIKKSKAILGRGEATGHQDKKDRK